MSSETTREQRRVPWLSFPGVWCMVAGAVQAFIGYLVIYYGWSVFSRFYAADLKWTMAELGLGQSATRFAGVFGAPAGGWVVDHWGPRWGTMLFLGLMGLGFIGVATMTEVWQMILWYGLLINFFYYGGLYRMSYTAVNRWWVDRRAFGIAFVTLGGGMGGVVGLAPLALAMTEYGWRPVAFWCGIAISVIAVAVAWLYPHHMPEHYGMAVDNMTPDERRARAERAAARRGTRVVMRPPLADVTTGQALRSFTFWMLVISGLIVAFAGAPVTLFQNIRMGQLGYSAVEAAAWYSVNNTLTFVGRFGVMFLGDWFSTRFPPRVNMAVSYFLMCIGLCFFAFGTEVWYFYAWALFYGVGFGISVPYFAVLMGAYFGRAAFGTIYGLRVGLAAIGGIISPTFLGWVSDISKGDWVLPFLIIAGGYLLGGLTIILAIPPKEQVRERSAT